MQRIILFSFSLLLLITGTGCVTSKSMTKKGSQFEQAGQYKSAADLYQQAVARKGNNVEAVQGLQRTAQKVLNDHLDEFFKQKTTQNKKEAVYQFLKAEKYKENIERYQVKLDIPMHYYTDFEQVKSAYLDDLYRDGTTFLEEENYSAAERCFHEISRLDPNFKDAEELKDVAYAEPLYREGTDFLEQQNYREAYASFDKALKRKANYKDATELKAKALELGTITLAVLKFENATTTKNIESKFNAYTTNALANLNDPFLKVVDREHLENILAEQELSLSGIFDQNTAAKVGALVGAKVALIGKVIDYTPKQGSIKRLKQKGFERYKAKRYVEAEDKTYYDTKYKAVEYFQYKGSNRIHISFQYKLVSLETGEILKSDILEKEVEDNVDYITYSGNKNELFPAGGDGKVNTSKNAKQLVDQQLNARRGLKSINEMANGIYKSMCNQVAADSRQKIIEKF